MKNILLYLATVLIWGSTWLAITYQLGSVDPMVSVAYRFGLAGALLLAWLRVGGRPLVFSASEHGFMALQGTVLFSVNYWFVYMAETRMTSGLVAVVFSTIVFFNVLNGRWLLGMPIRRSMVAGAMVGMGGISILFYPEIRSFSLADQGLSGMLFCLCGVFLASLGNMVSARNQKQGLPVLATNGFGMVYGGLVMAGLALCLGRPFTLAWTPGYLFSLGYLAVFGSIVAFGCYLTLVGRMGPDRASYAIMLVPAVALAISSVFESYQWTPISGAGLALVVIGNLLISRRPSVRVCVLQATGTGLGPWAWAARMAHRLMALPVAGGKGLTGR
jgi:drug/metabolite transporter (DMT)-like permease